MFAALLQSAFHITIASAIERVSGGAPITALTTAGSATIALLTASSVAHVPDGAAVEMESGSKAIACPPDA